jgi:hypothetical protein
VVSARGDAETADSTLLTLTCLTACDGVQTVSELSPARDDGWRHRQAELDAQVIMQGMAQARQRAEQLARLKAIGPILQDTPPYDVLTLCARALAEVVPNCCEALQDEFPGGVSIASPSGKSRSRLRPPRTTTTCRCTEGGGTITRGTMLTSIS